ncbi:Protein yippee-like 1 [Camellia lanceoleosa]|uniref:Protein yippee-like 1 n=1 Tax=Camellia lanceoleosa TaxID=1840588 RepID=A0ACC0HPU5_9ERIC|nr:Protein yippee-like 1 [Camellia lanceoleosa]
MGRVFLIYFDETPVTRFYLCGACPAHMALRQELVVFGNQGLSPVIFVLRRRDVNVYALSPGQDRMVGARTLSDVYCNNCGNLLGVKFIEVANDDDGAVRAGYFLLYRKNLRKWNGQGIVA